MVRPLRIQKKEKRANDAFIHKACKISKFFFLLLLKLFLDLSKYYFQVIK